MDETDGPCVVHDACSDLNLEPRFIKKPYNI